MDVVLVYPKTGWDIKQATIDLPLSVLSIASTIVDDYDVKIIDQRIDENWEKTLTNEVKEEPLCVGISSMTGTQIEHALKASKIVKKNSNAKVVWGGIHPTLLPEQTCLNNNIDIVVMGEGEIVFKNIVDNLRRNNSLHNIMGITFKENRKIKTNLPEKIIDLNNLPDIPYELVNANNYIRGCKSDIRPNIKRSLSFASSKGCPHKCTFCHNPKLDNCWRSMNAENTAKKTIELCERFNLEAINFLDDNFLVDTKRAEKIARLINGKFEWTIQARIDDLNKVTLSKMVNGGLSIVQTGIESGSDRMLQTLKKGFTVQQIIEGNKNIAKFDIWPAYYFMMGFPTETKQELMMSVDLALRLLEDNKNAQITAFYFFTPSSPGSALFEKAIKKGFRPPDNLGAWAKFSRQHIDTKEFKEDIELYKNIRFSSKLLDGKRMKNSINMPIPTFLFNWAGKYYRCRWKKHDFKTKIDNLLLDYIAKLYVKS